MRMTSAESRTEVARKSPSCIIMLRLPLILRGEEMVQMMPKLCEFATECAREQVAFPQRRWRRWVQRRGLSRQGLADSPRVAPGLVFSVALGL